MACPMCTGTDCAGACDQGECYAEEMQLRQDDGESEQRLRRCESNLVNVGGSCVWCGAAHGEACLDPAAPETLIPA